MTGPMRIASALLAALIFSVLAAGCAETIANRCPDSPAPRCLSGTVCQEDHARGCQVCRCDTPYLVPESQPPQGSPTPIGQ
jgi:hypothetical protein